MNELMQQWIDNLSEFGKYIEYHVIEGETSTHHIRDNFGEDIYYALVEYKNTNTNFDELESTMGHKLPEEFKNMHKNSYFALEDDDGNIYTGLHRIGLLNNHVQIEECHNPKEVYTEDELEIIKNGFSIGKSHLSDDSVIFISYNLEKQVVLGIHNHDDLFERILPYSMEALISLIDEDFEAFKELIIEGFEDDEIEY